MASYITSAGAASGIDFESIITASLAAKRAQLEKQTTTKKETANIELSGIGKLNDALTTFQKSLETLSSAEGFNTRKVTTTQPDDNPYFTVTTKDDAANGSYDIAVKQLASSEKISQTFSDDEVLQAGQLKLTVQVGTTGDDGKTTYEAKEISIDVAEGTTIAQLRRKINEQAGDYGVNASIVETDGKQKLTIDTGLSGSDESTIANRFSMSFTPTDPNAAGAGSKLNYSGSQSVTDDNNQVGDWSVKKGQNAIISVDGDDVTSTTNNFDGKVSGLNITVNRVTESKDDSGNKIYNTYQVNVEQDIDAITNKVQSFINSYNTLMDTMDALGKRNTYTDGENNMDGGELAGDSQLQMLQRQIQSVMSDIKFGELDAYSLGFKLDSEGRFSLDSTKFKEGIENNFNAVVKMFSGKDDATTAADESGLMDRLNSMTKEFTKTNGFLDQREQDLNMTISRYEKQEAENEDYLAKYEENLRAKYATLDTTIANYNNSLIYLQSVLG